MKMPLVKWPVSWFSMCMFVTIMHHSCYDYWILFHIKAQHTKLFLEIHENSPAPKSRLALVARTRLVSYQRVWDILNLSLKCPFINICDLILLLTPRLWNSVSITSEYFNINLCKTIRHLQHTVPKAFKALSTNRSPGENKTPLNQ